MGTAISSERRGRFFPPPERRRVSTPRVLMTETKHNETKGQSRELVLHGERIFLRRPQMSDAAKVFHWERDDEVWRYDPHRPYSNSMAEFLPVFERNYVRGNGRQHWFIIEDEQHRPIGTITYFNIDHRLGHVEIGLGLGDKSSWGKGYGPEAIRTLSHYLFTTLGFNRIYAETAMVNHPARRAFAKAHFIEVGQIYDPRSSGTPWVLLELWRRNYYEFNRGNP
jgi:ribosomal-protein-alanine N-acetyltransferase